jgi:methyl-accepting chemotaxis protein
MKNNKYPLIVFILLSLSVVSITVIFYQQSKEKNINIKDDVLDVIDQRMADTYAEVNNFPATPANNLLFLSKLSDFQKPITNQNIKDIEKDFSDFLSQSEAYYQISYLDKSGIEKIRAESRGASPQIISLTSSTNQENINYFNLVKNLKNGEVYVFPLDLNTKSGVIENRGSNTNPQYVPVLRYAVPIFNQQTNKSTGIILVKVYADYFLENIRRSQREGETTYLIDNKGFYLANPNKNKEFGYLFNNQKNNFFIDFPFPLVSQEIMTKCLSRRQETNKQIFTYRCINPATINFEIYQGSKTIEGKSISDYQWLLVTVTDKSDGLKDVSPNENDFLWAIFIQILIQAIVFVLFITQTKSYEKNN